VAVQNEHLGDQPLAVKAIRDRKGAQTGDDKPESVDRFAFVESGESDGTGSERGDGDPDENLQRLGHGLEKLSSCCATGDLE
jgi:hypothetical protein